MKSNTVVDAMRYLRVRAGDVVSEFATIFGLIEAGYTNDVIEGVMSKLQTR